MTAWRILTAATLACCCAYASEPPESRPIAPDTPAFEAPEEPPDPDAERVPVSAPEGPLNLHDGLALALMGNSELAEFSWETRAAEARIVQAGKPPNPEFDLRLWRLAFQDGTQNVERGRFIISQPLEVGGQRGRRVDLATAEQEVAVREYQMMRAEVATTLRFRFVAVLGAQHRVETTRQTIEFVERVQVQVEGLVDSGAVRSMEKHRIARHLGLERIDLHRAESDLVRERSRLAALWGSLDPRFTEVVGDLETIPEVPDIATVHELSRQGPAVARWDAVRKSSDAAIALAKANRAPAFSVGAGARYSETQARPDWILDFDLELPIYDRKQGDIREARYRRARAEESRESAAAVASALIVEYYQAFREAEARRSTMAEEVIPAARALLEVYELAFGSGAANLDDLLDARRDLAKAQIDHTDALVDLHQALAALEGVVGQTLTKPE